MTEPRRAHGVTPGLSRDYADRTVERQGAFVLPLLRPGMRLLDVGCGPGTITVGLARGVAPGEVVGLDHDPEHVAASRALAREMGVGNATFREGDARSLPFEDGTFDVVFENNVFTHLPGEVGRAAGEAYRVVRPGGFFAARDVDGDAVIWGGRDEWMERFDVLFRDWQRSRGSDITMGRRLPSILREAGFAPTRKSVSADTKGTVEAVRGHAEIMAFLLDGPVGDHARNAGLATDEERKRMRASVVRWGGDPDAFFANIHVEVVGWKRPEE